MKRNKSNTAKTKNEKRRTKNEERKTKNEKRRTKNGEEIFMLKQFHHLRTKSALVLIKILFSCI